MHGYNHEDHEYLSSGNGVVPYGCTDMKKKIIAFCNFANVSTLQLESCTFVPNFTQHC